MSRSDLLARLERVETCVLQATAQDKRLPPAFNEEARLDALALAEARAALARLDALERMLPRCPECGPTKIDEDGCCTGCGADAAPPTEEP